MFPLSVRGQVGWMPPRGDSRLCNQIYITREPRPCGPYGLRLMEHNSGRCFI